MKKILLGLIAVGLGVWCAVPAWGATKTWKAATTGDWFEASNWEEVGGAPQAGDEVVITADGAWVLLTNSTDYLGSFTLSQTLVFSNWNTTLSATNVTILTNGVVTLPPAFTDVQMSNNVYLVCSNLTIDAGGTIDADGKGYAGGSASHTAGYGPGGGTNYCGGGYGGFGGGYQHPMYIGQPYGSVSEPLEPGSAGGAARPSAFVSTPGGGAVRIQADGLVVVNGTVSANGLDATSYSDNYVGCGSGGAIYLQCDRFAGTNGVLSARGGGGLSTSGPGGGGRIAVAYNPASQSAMPRPSVKILATPGYSTSHPNARAGTICLPDASLLSETITHISGNIWGISAWTTPSLMVSNVWLGFPEEGMTLTVSNDLVIVGSEARLELGGNQGVYTNNRIFLTAIP